MIFSGWFSRKILPKFTGLLSTKTLAEKLSKTVGMYSPGKAFVV